MKRLATICVRGGSKGMPQKNLRVICGKPLVAYSIEQARDSAMFDLVVVSSDEPELLRIATDFGAGLSIARPPELATDQAPKLPAIRHCLQVAEQTTGHRYDTIADLDATAPLRSIDDIRGAIELLESGHGDNVLTGSAARHSPYFNLVERDDEGRIRVSKPVTPPLYCRQDSPACFDLNGSVYVWRREALLGGIDSAIGPNTLIFEMPQDRSFDIDSDVDFRIVEMMLARAVAEA